MIEFCVLERPERRRVLPWVRAHSGRELPEQLDRLVASGAHFLSVGDLLALRRGIADEDPEPEVALAVRGDASFVLSATAAILERDLPCLALAAIGERHGHPGVQASHAELRALHEWGVPIECAGFAEWEQGRASVEQVFGAMLRVRRQLERVVGRAPVLYSLATRNPRAGFLDLLERAGFELHVGELGSGAAIERHGLRDAARRRARLAAG